MLSLYLFATALFGATTTHSITELDVDQLCNASREYSLNRESDADDQEQAGRLIGEIKLGKISALSIMEERSGVIFHVVNEAFAVEDDLEFDADTAMLLLISSASRGDVRSLYLLGKFVLDIKKDKQNALHILECAAQNGSSAAEGELASIYLFVDHTNTESGLKYLISAAKSRQPLSLLQLGLLYSEGRHVEESPDKAARLYKEAAESGLALAAINYAILLNAGWPGQFPEKKKAAEWFLKAAALGDVRGYAFAGQTYVEIGDVEQGITLLEKAVSLGYVEAVEYLNYSKELKHRAEEDAGK